MKRTVLVDGNPIELEFRCEGDVYRFRNGGGPEREASVRRVEPGIYSVLLEGRSFEVKAVPGSGGLYLDLHGRRLAVRVIDEREAEPRAGPGGLDLINNVSAPMPGRVVRVLVSSGDRVVKGQGLVVVEAMKMQNEMQAPRDGRVVSVGAQEGGAVAAGQVLVTIE
jgi:acetyl/propionyl-CoA carboxylase alpha subunit